MPYKRRKNISSESYGIFNKLEEVKSNIVPNNKLSSEKQNFIKEHLVKSFIFQAFINDNNNLNMIINAFEEYFFIANTKIILQDEEGSILYLIYEGEVEESCLIDVTDNINVIITFVNA